MSTSMTRMIHMDDWIFEVKMVRALRVRRYGEPYSAVATLSANGENIYIDTQMTREGEEFSRRDFMTFYRFCQGLDAKYVNYDRIKNGVRHQRTVTIHENVEPQPIVRLVR